MILFAASPLDNDGKNYWQEAYEVNKASLENLRAQGYELYIKKLIFHKPICQTKLLGPNKNVNTALHIEYLRSPRPYSYNPVDKETIFQSREGQGNIWDIDGIAAQDGYKSGTCPSQGNW